MFNNNRFPGYLNLLFFGSAHFRIFFLITYKYLFIRDLIVMDNSSSESGNICPETNFSNAGFPNLTQSESFSQTPADLNNPNRSDVPFFFPLSNQHLSVVNGKNLSNADVKTRFPPDRDRQKNLDSLQPTNRSIIQSSVSVSVVSPVFN